MDKFVISVIWVRLILGFVIYKATPVLVLAAIMHWSGLTDLSWIWS